MSGFIGPFHRDSGSCRPVPYADKGLLVHRVESVAAAPIIRDF